MYSSVGACALTAKMGGITTMLPELLTQFWPPAPVLIMGICATFAGILAATLPETLNTQLPDNFIQAENIGKNDGPCKK